MKKALLSRQLSQHDENLLFLAAKGLDIESQEGLEQALFWVSTTSPDNLLYGDPMGHPHDIMEGSLRRPMLIETVKTELRKVGEDRNPRS